MPDPAPASAPEPEPGPEPGPGPAAPSGAAPAASVLAIVNDLFFQAKIGEVHRFLGVPVSFAKTPEALARALAAGPLALALVDMSARGVDAVEAVRTLRRERPSLAIVAFVSHVDKETRQRALDAGASDAWAKSRLERELPDLVRRWTSGEGG